MENLQSRSRIIAAAYDPSGLLSTLRRNLAAPGAASVASLKGGLCATPWRGGFSAILHNPKQLRLADHCSASDLRSAEVCPNSTTPELCTWPAICPRRCGAHLAVTRIRMWSSRGLYKTPYVGGIKEQAAANPNRGALSMPNPGTDCVRADLKRQRYFRQREKLRNYRTHCLPPPYAHPSPFGCPCMRLVRRSSMAAVDRSQRFSWRLAGILPAQINAYTALREIPNRFAASLGLNPDCFFIAPHTSRS
jgi:hypothetical protein